jgi:hypothetical protein
MYGSSRNAYSNWNDGGQLQIDFEWDLPEGLTDADEDEVAQQLRNFCGAFLRSTEDNKYGLCDIFSLNATENAKSVLTGSRVFCIDSGRGAKSEIDKVGNYLIAKFLVNWGIAAQ